MPKGLYKTPEISNEPVKSYAPGSKEKKELKAALKSVKSEEADIPMVINGKEIRTGNTGTLHPPHEKNHTLAKYHKGDKSHVQDAIDAALKAKPEWENMSWEHRASIFLKAADLLAGPYRAEMNAVTMQGQSKNAFQSEIDAACELIDFFRFNVKYMTQIYEDQPPFSPEGIWNRMEYRPLEGFVLAIPPFNFTSIAVNLPTAPALMGNTVIWKPSTETNYASYLAMQILKKAGLPDGVINLVFTDGPDTSEVALNHPDLAGLHFTGSVPTFQSLWKTIGNNISKYKTYPRIVGETGGKDFVIAHPSADPQAVVTGLSRGAFEYQGQKCSAASRAYIPSNMWDHVKKGLQEDVSSFKMGTVENFTNFINAVIHERAFKKITGYIDQAKSDGMDIITGGEYDDSEGYFIKPTVIKTDDPGYTTMCEEIFGPVLTLHVYDENKFEDILNIADKTSPFGLTGGIFAQDRQAIELATKRLTHSAGNFYINDKPTGAVVGQQPFGGARASGTNDKAGSLWNLIRWVSPRSIKENMVPPHNYRYPFLEEE